MRKEYDETIDQHYKAVAREHGIAATSTMLDEIIRKRETEAISQFVSESLRISQAEGPGEQALIMDVGCGNGYTLEQIEKQHPEHNYIGIEKSNELRLLAESRFPGNDKVSVFEGDIRKTDFANGVYADILICQRVLINLLDISDQKKALENMVAVVRSPSTRRRGGTLLFIEGFVGPLARLNEARDEFNLPPILPAHHNLYLPDDFFQCTQLRPLQTDGFLIPSNFLSTHYFVTRVLNAILLPENKPFKRNSEFSRFFADAVNQNAGDYSPLKLHVFEKSQ
ncbi:MAG: class I SAM-dependent methyltransferase [Armatimonadetes bacterium]|nr:class I SAM-dependent methyltransferase [Armatimonadota bacterium]